MFSQQGHIYKLFTDKVIFPIFLAFLCAWAYSMSGGLRNGSY